MITVSPATGTVTVDDTEYNTSEYQNGISILEPQSEGNPSSTEWMFSGTVNKTDSESLMFLNVELSPGWSYSEEYPKVYTKRAQPNREFSEPIIVDGDIVVVDFAKLIELTAENTPYLSVIEFKITDGESTKVFEYAFRGITFNEV